MDTAVYRYDRGNVVILPAWKTEFSLLQNVKNSCSYISTPPHAFVECTGTTVPSYMYEYSFKCTDVHTLCKPLTGITNKFSVGTL